MGTVHVVIADGPLPDAPLPAGDERAGAVLHFLGVVRPTEHGRAISGLEYVAYQPMAERVLEQLADEAVARFGVLAVKAEHSRGFVPIGACSFRLVVAGVHRRESVDAVDWFIERMKQDVPIWKHAVPAEETATLGSLQGRLP